MRVAFLTLGLVISLAAASVSVAKTVYPRLRNVDGAVDTIVVSAVDSGMRQRFYAAEVRYAVPSASLRRRGLTSWGMRWENGVEVTLEFDLRGHVDGAAAPAVKVELTPGFGADPLLATVSSGMDFHGGPNTLCLEWREGVASVFVGSKRLGNAFVASSLCPSGDCLIFSSAPARFDDAAFESVADPTPVVAYDVETLPIGGEAPLAGVWEYLDRDANEDLAKMGGRYRLAFVPTDGSGYDVVYLGGAVTNASGWLPGMVKGRVQSRGFVDNFGLTWLDAMYEPMGDDCYVSVHSDDVISLNFPLYSASFRLRRCR